MIEGPVREGIKMSKESPVSPGKRESGFELSWGTKISGKKSNNIRKI